MSFTAPPTSSSATTCSMATRSFQQKISAPGFTYMDDQLRYNQFGGVLGGPIKKENTFFFGSVQITRDRTISQTRMLYPTDAMIQGDFSGLNPETGANFGPVYDPQYWPASVQFAGNKIPSTRFSSFAKKFISAALLPANCLTCLTEGLGFDFVGNSPGRLYANQYMGRIDHRFSEKDSLFGNFQLDSGISTWNTTPIDAQRMDTPSRNVSVGISETHIFSPGLVNEFRAGYVRWRLALDQEQDAQGAFTYQNTPFSLPSLYPTLFIGAYPSFGNGQAGNNSNDVEESWDFTDRLTYMHGRHQIKAGVEILRAHFYDVLNQNAFFLYADSLPPPLWFHQLCFFRLTSGVPFRRGDGSGNRQTLHGGAVRLRRLPHG